ncbi:MAG: acyloxyacyl hydrolase [Alphaproteobacteria bacterium]|nr:acyloxyacyl hydrolase [Alphaproteobacteria bacterium]
MRKLLVFLAVIAPFAAASAEEQASNNPFFGDKQNQIHLMLGQGFDSGELILFKHSDRPVPYYMLALEYSQPNTFFRIPGRQTLSAIKTIGVGRGDYFGNCRYNVCDWGNYGAEIFMISQDIAWAPWGGRFYFGTGIGPAIQGKYNERLNTKFLLGFRMMAGYRISDSWNAELIMQHFSNADTGTNNNVYDFYAIGIAYNF